MRKLRFFYYPIVLSIIIILVSNTRGAITSITLTPANPTNLSSGLGYYLAGITYDFSVNVIDPAAVNWAGISDVRVTIPNSTNIIVSINPPNAGAGQAITINSGTVSGVADISGTFNNFTCTFKITFQWNTEESIWAASRNIVASATNGGPLTDTKSVSYGVCSTMKMLNFAQSGNAADGLINPYYSNFNVTGRVVYNVPGTTISDAINTIDAGEITAAALLLDGAPSAFANGGTADNINFTVTAANAVLENLGAHSWRIRGTMTTAPNSEDTTAASDLSLTTDRVLVTGLTLSAGGGRNNAPYYWRSLLVSGTVFTVTAQMQNSAGAMVANTTFTINWNGGVQFTITVPTGSNSASIIIPPGSIPAVAIGNAGSYTYYITRIQNNSYGDQGDGTFGAGPLLQIVDNGNYPGAYYTNPVVYWENTDPPSNNVIPPQAIIVNKVSPSATSLTFYWDPLDTSNTSFDGDFYEYRVYFKEDSASVYKQFDGDDDSTLRGIANNPFPAPVSDPVRHFDASGWKYTTITNLKLYTSYEYYITAVDVFGNEIADANAGPADDGSRTVRTQPFSIEVSVSDGITGYEKVSFDADPTPTARSLRETNIRVEISIVASTELPDTVRVWYTTGDQTTTPDIVTASNTVNSGAFSANTLFSADAQKIGPNKWVAFLPSTTPVISYGNSVRFIVESSLNDVSSFTDSIIEDPMNPNNNEWTFYIGSRINFKPWPVRILNNVITKKHPVAYPSYYLTDDAFVTIRVYDIKGRPVVTLMDRAFRRGGQNIKESGWRGYNKARRKLGVGLYYVHIRAKRVSDGKVILNKFKKVVMAR